MTDQDWQYCPLCSGDGHYQYDSDIFYSYSSTTHKYLAECDECNGSGRIYDEEE